MMTTQTKCPLTGLNAIENKRGGKLYYGIKDSEGKVIYSYGIDAQSELPSLAKNDKGKLFQWLVQTLENKNNSNTFIIPESFIRKNDRDKGSPLNRTIKPPQKIEWLLEYIYRDFEALGGKKSIYPEQVYPILATVDLDEVKALLQELIENNYLKGKSNINFTGCFYIEPTLEGFKAYDVLMKGKAHSDFGFLALEFDDSNLFYPKLKEFLKQEMKIDLKDQRERNITGNINVSMEANIRKCRFMIADIRPSIKIEDNKLIPNANVMWEAGFAEGLNKPVLYICKQIIKDAPFDVRNHYCIEYGECIKYDEKKDCIEYGETDKSHHNACVLIKEALENTFAQRGE